MDPIPPRQRHGLVISLTPGCPAARLRRALTGRFVMLGLILSIIIIGLIAGALARLLVPGRQHMSIPMTVLLGVVGSFVSGFLGYLLFHKDAQDGFFQPSGVVGSIIGAIIVLLVWTHFGARSAVRH